MRKIGLVIAIIAVVSGCKKVDKVSVPTVEAPSEVIEAAEMQIAPVLNRGEWVVTASSQEAEMRPALLADADKTSRWSSEFKNDQWVMIDLGKKVPLASMRLFWEDAFARVYEVQLSEDGKEWQTVVDQTAGRGGTEDVVFDPVKARYVRLALQERATEWGFSLFEIDFNPLTEEVIEGAVATASTGGGDGAAQMAIDGDLSTRWCSGFNDADWWQVEFPAPEKIGGMKILWETAFAEKYHVDVSMDGETWKTVYNVEEGDGLTDLIFFEPQDARFVKIQCRQRGTGWGNSIWEIDFYKEDRLPSLEASGTQAGSRPVNALDGDPATQWHSEKDGKQDLILSLPDQLDLGGIFVSWGDDYAVEYNVDIDSGSGDWRTVYEKRRGNGGRDMMFFASAPARKVRLHMLQSNEGNGYGVAEIEFKSGEEQATPIRHYKAAAKDAPRGWYPQWLLREQEFWTVTGVIDDEQESLVSETGIIEPHKGDFSIQPFIIVNDQLVTWNDVTVRQNLEEDSLPMPGVRWSKDDWRLDIQAVSFGPVGDSMTVARYRLTNKGAESFTGKLALAVRPVQLNPTWQHGGFSAIMNAECVPAPAPAHVNINGQTRIVLPNPPSAMGAAMLEDGDIVEFLSNNEMPEALTVSEPEGKNSIGVLYDLDVPPGESREIVVVYLLYDDNQVPPDLLDAPSDGFKRIWQEQKKHWHEVLNRFDIDMPDERLVKMMKSNIAYILINKDGPFVKPGSRNYAHAWIRDGAMTSVTLLRMGLIAPIRDYINAYTPLVADNGWAPFIILEDGNPVSFNHSGHEGQEYDSQGQYAFLIRQYYDFSGDKALVEQVYPTLVKVLQFGKERRAMRMTDEYKNDPEKRAYYGILPESNSHEGYFPAMHSYWDDFWMLRGYKDGAYLADQLGHAEDAVWMRAEEEDLRKCLLDSIQMVMERDNLDTIPGCVEKGDFDATSTAIAIMACGEGDTLPEPYRSNTFNRYYDDFVRGNNSEFGRTFTPYEVRTADAFVRMGVREKGLAMLRYFTENSVHPYDWNHMAEVVHARARAPSYIGDMPHTWVGSGYINAVRSIFAYEEGDTLVVAAGVDPLWLDDKGVTVTKLPTQFGWIDYTIRKGADGGVVMNVSGEATPPGGFVVPLPEAWNGLSVEVNGASANTVDGAVIFDALPVEITLK